MIDTKALRSRILDLAIQGKLTEQLESDGTAEELYQQIQAKKQALIKEGKIKKEKPLPEISADEIPFEIPGNWKMIRLSDISMVISKGTTPSGGKVSYLESGIGFLRAENLIGFDKIDTSNLKFIDEETHLGYLKRSILESGDILISIAGTLGRTGIVSEEDLPLNTNQAIAFIRLCKKDLCCLEYIAFMLNTAFVQKALGFKKVDMAIPNLSLNVISNIILPLPPLAEQKRIVERVEEIFRLLDTIDKAQEKYSADSQILKAKLITAGIQGKLTKQLESDGTAEELYQQIQEEKQKLIKEGKIKKEKPLPPVSPEEVPFEIPENWMWVRFDEISNILCTGLIRSGKEQYKEAEYYYFKMQNIGNFTGKCNYDDMVMINASQEEFEKTKLEEGDFLFNTRNSAELVGKTAVVHNMPIPKIILNNNILKIQFYGHINPDYINYYFISSVGRKLLYQFVSSTTNVAAIYQRQIVTLPLPLPPLAEQKRIADVLERVLGALE